MTVAKLEYYFRHFSWITKTDETTRVKQMNAGRSDKQLGVTSTVACFRDANDTAFILIIVVAYVTSLEDKSHKQ
jgi:hypothetical protein